MRIELQLDVFQDQWTAHLRGIIYWALRGRHRILVEDDKADEFVSWLSNQGERDRDEWTEVLHTSYVLEAREPARRVLRIAAVGHTEWTLTPPTVKVEDAANVMSWPFKILLEDSTSDRAFIFAMATEEQRRYLQALEEEKAVLFDHGGGIGSMTRTMRIRLDGDASAPLWHYVIFDSDSLQPGQPSAQSEALRQTCSDFDVPHYQLKRRSIENYLPRNTLRGWVYRGHKNKESTFIALTDLSDIQRHHYNYKAGFRGDAQRPAPAAGSLYADLVARQVAALQDGFGNDIASLYGEATEQDLRREGGWSEINPVVTEIIAILR